MEAGDFKIGATTVAAVGSVIAANPPIGIAIAGAIVILAAGGAVATAISAANKDKKDK